MPLPAFTSPTLSAAKHLTGALAAVLVAWLGLASASSAQYSVDTQQRWATYNGGIGNDQVLSVATDAFGHLYVAGRATEALRLGNDTTGRSGLTHQRNYGGGGSDAFLAKIAPQGSLLWCTYFGGPGEDEAVQVVVDGMDGVYLVGNTNSTDSIATDTLSFQQEAGGGHDIFVAYFTEYGLLTGATYFGGGGNEIAYDAALDATGKLVVCGKSDSAITTVADSLWQGEWAGGEDGLLLRFAGTGQLVAGTLIGGPGDDELVQVAPSGEVRLLLAGNTTSTTGFPADTLFPSLPQGGWDAFLMKVDTLLQPTEGTYFFGGTDDDRVQGMACTGDSIVIVGSTRSDTLHTDSTAYQRANGGNGDGFLAVLDTTFLLQWCTFVGDTGQDVLAVVRIDDLGRIYAAGTTRSDSAMVLPGEPFSELLGTADAFLMCFDTTQTTAWVRYYGAMGEESALALAVKGKTSLFVGGFTGSTEGLSDNGHQMDFGGGDHDGFTSRLDQRISTMAGGICLGGAPGGGGGAGPSNYSSVSPPLNELHVCRGDTVMLIVFGGALGYDAEWMWYEDGCGIPERFLTMGDTLIMVPDHNFVLSVRAEGFDHTTSCSTLHVYVHDWPEPLISVPEQVCAGAPLALHGTGAESFIWLEGDSVLATTADTTITAPMEPGHWVLTAVGFNGPSCAVSLKDTVLVLPAPDVAWVAVGTTCTDGDDGWIQLILPDSSSTDTTGFTYAWEPPGPEGPWITGLPPGIYAVTVTDTLGCTAVYDTLLVTSPAPLIDSLAISPAACGAPTGAVQVYTHSTAFGLAYDLGDGPSQATYRNGLPPGEYTITATDSAGCTETRSFTIEAIGQIQVVTEQDTVITVNGVAMLHCHVLPSDSAATVQWTPSTPVDDPYATSTFCTVTDTILFVVTATSTAGCVASDSTLVIPEHQQPPTLEEPCGDFFLPDHFSPNGDGQNDLLCIMGGCLTEVEWNIHDRWGGPVFSTTAPDACWDGTHRDAALPAGTYLYSLRAVRSTGEELQRTGTITLMR